jgi:hypothetical protein
MTVRLVQLAPQLFDILLKDQLLALEFENFAGLILDDPCLGEHQRELSLNSANEGMPTSE